eukprot:scaffold2607_cov118-Isochrysis_galbana.AAC.8
MSVCLPPRLDRAFYLRFFCFRLAIPAAAAIPPPRPPRPPRRADPFSFPRKDNPRRGGRAVIPLRDRDSPLASLPPPPSGAPPPAPHHPLPLRLPTPMFNSAARVGAPLSVRYVRWPAIALPASRSSVIGATRHTHTRHSPTRLAQAVAPAA